MLTLFHPATGQVRVRGVTSCPNVVLHAWLEAELLTILEALPPLRLLLVMDNLKGHTTAGSVVWLFEHGVMPLYTPLSGSWLNMTESIQRIVAHRALAGQTPANPTQLILWLEATARAWNADPTPFEWAGKRKARRERAYRRRHPLGGSGACTRTPIRRRLQFREQWRNWGLTIIGTENRHMDRRNLGRNRRRRPLDLGADETRRARRLQAARSGNAPRS